MQQLVREVGAKCRVDARIDFVAEPLSRALVEYGAVPEHAVTFKANMLPSTVSEFCRAADGAIHAHAGSGIVRGHWDGGLTLEQAASMLKDWRERAGKGQGSVIVERCPSEWKKTLSVWGPSRGDAWLMREVKNKFDPRGVFNPGRFLDGI